MKIESIGDLIDEIIDLKLEIRRQKRKNIESWISYLEMFHDTLIKTNGHYNVDNHLEGLKRELEKLK